MKGQKASIKGKSKMTIGKYIQIKNWRSKDQERQLTIHRLQKDIAPCLDMKKYIQITERKRKWRK